MDDSVHECRDSHASSSRKPSSEPMPTSSEDLGKHSVNDFRFPIGLQELLQASLSFL